MLADVCAEVMVMFFALCESVGVSELTALVVGMFVTMLWTRQRTVRVEVADQATVNMVDMGSQTDLTLQMTTTVRYPDRIVTTRTGACFHLESCGHVRHHPTQTYRKCADCCGR